jgi:8-oxo-dGTP pyrophosphatase MutT (NUDIX family)
VGFGATPILTGPSDWRFAPDHAAVGLIVVDGARFLLQHRDRMDGILYPEYWGLFGGAFDAGETSEAALHRELEEELSLTFDTAEYFTAVNYDFRFCGKGIVNREYYLIHISAAERAELVLGEGQGMADFSAEEVMALDKIVPFDAFAIWLYIHRGELAQ